MRGATSAYLDGSRPSGEPGTAEVPQRRRVDAMVVEDAGVDVRDDRVEHHDRVATWIRCRYRGPDRVFEQRHQGLDGALQLDRMALREPKVLPDVDPGVAGASGSQLEHARDEHPHLFERVG